ncbi:hypothetical protein BLJ79_15055 [Arthrobacter sp. UCD-GKA]|uniref:hypothetical protein n=1 Tax=Arthrobacter sp. UCD-GKA TaxID=1913576 RepID=UPI0008DE1DB9|nr:hypothetical protein [Arthrobacter sp. UCD-GKA]OIH83403.1 hypothetical protein BLJ79_15055 [Arthrobacter sp. UCD-GKA]
MDYNDFELVAFWVLCLAAALPLVAIGTYVHVRRGARALDWYMFLGCLGSIVYGLFAGMAVGAVFPPPYVPGLSEGKGLDMRGISLVFGSWFGGILGFLATLATFATSKSVRWRRHRRAARSARVHTPGTGQE